MSSKNEEPYQPGSKIRRGVVLDPVAGSGTTAVAAGGLGRAGLAFDLDPLAVILARVATAPLDLEAARRAHERVLAQATAAAKEPDWRPAAIAPAEEQEFLVLVSEALSAGTLRARRGDPC